LRSNRRIISNPIAIFILAFVLRNFAEKNTTTKLWFSWKEKLGTSIFLVIDTITRKKLLRKTYDLCGCHYFRIICRLGKLHTTDRRPKHHRLESTGRFASSVSA
jgi:hypothetical protein